MTHTFPAVLRDGRIEWTGDPPPGLPAGVAVPVQVTVALPADPPDEAERRVRLLAALERLVELGTAEKFGDPVEWQRVQRRDRPLPGRDP